MGYDITEWLNKNHHEWYDLHSDNGEVRCHAWEPPADATHFRHIGMQYRRAGVYYKIERQHPGESYSYDFMCYMIPGYSDWRSVHLSTMKDDVAEVKENCFQISRVEGPFMYNRETRMNETKKFPIKVKVTKAFLEELLQCESGREEDAEYARIINDQEMIKANDYACVFGDFGRRWKTQIECKNIEELKELYYVCASGTIGLRGYTKTANKVLDQIRETIKIFDPALVKRWPTQDGF
ncbi:hypothetical protein [Pseudomonas phage Astolliot]|nr:hypothetical protein [Pseudomonas phage Astolliot]